MKPSLTILFSVVFILFIFHSIWNIIGIFQAPSCNRGEICYSSYLNNKPPLDLLVYLTESYKSTSGQLMLNLNRFKYDEPFERYLIQ